MSSILNATDGNFEAACVGFKALFETELADSPDAKQAELLATQFESSSSDEKYTWLGAVPGMREWLGDREIGSLRASGYTVVNKRWANGIEVAETDFQDDRLGLIGARVRMLANQVSNHYVKLLIDLLTAGFTTTCYDGQFFFDTDHQDGTGPVQSNMLTATLDDAGAYDSAWQKALEIKNENSDPFGTTPTHLVVGPSNRATALAILKAENLAAGASNVNANSAELIISPRLVGAHATKWFLLDLSKPIKPLVLQIRQKPKFVAVTQDGAPMRFARGVYTFGAEGRHNAGYGLWQYAVGSNGTT